MNPYPDQFDILLLTLGVYFRVFYLHLSVVWGGVRISGRYLYETFQEDWPADPTIVLNCRVGIDSIEVLLRLKFQPVSIKTFCIMWHERHLIGAPSRVPGSVMGEKICATPHLLVVCYAFEQVSDKGIHSFRVWSLVSDAEFKILNNILHWYSLRATGPVVLGDVCLWHVAQERMADTSETTKKPAEPSSSGWHRFRVLFLWFIVVMILAWHFFWVLRCMRSVFRMACGLFLFQFRVVCRSTLQSEKKEILYVTANPKSWHGKNTYRGRFQCLMEFRPSWLADTSW